MFKVQPGEVWDRQQVADYYRVDVRTITRWRQNNRLPEPIDYPGGYPRWRASDIVGESQQTQSRDNLGQVGTSSE
ncbi:MAG: hypothetical protein AAGC72_16860 [Planctomycetota bacterium]